MNKRKHIRARRAVETRRLYRFEAVFLHPQFKPHINRPRSLQYLRRLARRVWDKHGRKGIGVPRIRVMDGLEWSYCVGYSDIVLATATRTRHHHPHDTIEVLLHELTHAMGYGTHGKGFVRKYVALLVEYGGCDEGELQLALASFGIKI